MDKPRVKPLTFRTVADGRMALTPVGPYRILEQPDGMFDVMFDGCLVNQRKKGEAFSSYEAAEIWAQTRHEKQILACVEALEPAPVSVQEAARVLGALPPNELRPILSNLANMTPDVVYYPNDFLSGFPDKKDGEGTSMGKTGQAALFLANSLAEHIEPGGEAVIRLGSISHGNQNNGDWTVTALRALAGDEGER